jgi:hypothetical protein
MNEWSYIWERCVCEAWLCGISGEHIGHFNVNIVTKTRTIALNE